MGKMKINWKALEATALALVREQAGTGAAGEEKLEAAVDGLIKAADKLIALSGAGEVLSDIALRTIVKPLLRGFVHDVYEKAKAAGEEL